MSINAFARAADNIQIDINMNDAAWQDIFRADNIDINVLAAAAINAAMCAPTPPQFDELSIALVSDEDIQVLNRDYRGKDAPTNVLSFAASAGPHGAPVPVLGDIVLARQTITAEAKALGISVSDHLTHLIIHGFYHLCGFDHVSDQDAAHMQAAEIEALKRLDITNPYDTDILL